MFSAISARPALVTCEESETIAYGSGWPLTLVAIVPVITRSEALSTAAT